MEQSKKLSANEKRLFVLKEIYNNTKSFSVFNEIKKLETKLLQS